MITHVKSEAEKKREKDVQGFIFMVGVWLLCFYLRFFTDNQHAEGAMNYVLVVLGLLLIFGLYAESKKDEKQKQAQQTQQKQQVKQQAETVARAKQISNEELEIQKRIQRTIDEL